MIVAAVVNFLTNLTGICFSGCCPLREIRDMSIIGFKLKELEPSSSLRIRDLSKSLFLAGFSLKLDFERLNGFGFVAWALPNICRFISSTFRSVCPAIQYLVSVA